MLNDRQVIRSIPTAETLEPRLLLSATFVDSTATLGLPTTLPSQYLHSGAIGDVNGDGYQDLFYGSFGTTPASNPPNDGTNRLYIFNPATGLYQESVQASINQSNGRTSGAVFADMDNDGDLDLLVMNNYRNSTGQDGMNQFLRNDGNGNFEDVTYGSHLADLPLSARNPFILDYNGDGLLDVLMQDDWWGNSDTTRLMKNNGDMTFTDVTVAAGLPTGNNAFVGIGGAVGDINGDTYPDILFAASVSGANPSAPNNRLFLNDGAANPGHFTEITSLTPINVTDATVPYGDTGWPSNVPGDGGENWCAGGAFGDLNNDGKIDMVIGDHFVSGMHGNAQISARVYMNTGNDAQGRPQFTDITSSSGVLAAALYSKMPEVDIQDFDNDGKMDIWVGNTMELTGTSTPVPYILYNTGNSGGVPHFVQTPGVDPANTYGGLDSYGLPVNPRYLVGAPTADFNHDGKLDIFTVEAFNAVNYPAIYLNTTPAMPNYLDVQISTGGANMDGIGATVRIYQAGHANDPAYLLGSSLMEIGNGYVSGRPADLHFGLGAATHVDVVATMPNGGTVYTASNVAANQVITLGNAPANHAPVSTADAYSINEDTTATYNVLTNDGDADGNSLTALLQRRPAHGTVTLNASGLSLYTPAPNYSGPDSFVYKASDGMGYGNSVVVSITVNAVNDAPATAGDSYRIFQSTARTIAAPGVLANDIDQEGSSLTAVLDSGVAHGTLGLNANGSFTYTPTAGYTGSDSFTYHAYDGTVSGNVVTVNLTVSPSSAPTGVADSYSTRKNQPAIVSASGVLANDTDPNSDSLSAVLQTGVSHGTLNLNANGSFTYTPTAAYAGGDSFTYKAYNGLSYSSTTTVTLTVAAPDVLFVVGNTTLTTADTRAKTELENLGYNVVVKQDTASVTGDATGKNMVVISSSVTPANILTKFRDVTVPVVTWEPGIYGQNWMKMTNGTSGSTYYGTQTSKTVLTINPSLTPSALTGGLNGAVTVFSSGQTISYGVPSANATTIATVASGKWGIFTYDTGATMVSQTAPARRVGLFPNDDTTDAAMTANGWKLFDAAIRWADASLDVTPPRVVSQSVVYGGTGRSQINAFVVKFSEDVGASLAVSDLTLRNQLTRLSVNLAGTSVSYDPTTFTATFDLSSLYLSRASYVATLSGAGIVDAAGNRLDGNADGTGGDDYNSPFTSIVGDANGDGVFNGFDITPFVQALVDPTTYGTQYPLLTANVVGDANGDGVLNGFDITPFVSLLIAGGSDSAIQALATPELAPVAQTIIDQTLSIPVAPQPLAVATVQLSPATRFTSATPPTTGVIAPIHGRQFIAPIAKTARTGLFGDPLVDILAITPIQDRLSVN